MGDPRGFLKVKRQELEYRPVCERVRDYRDVSLMRSEKASRSQASRCMDCGTPFCHWGCPLANYIPEWNDKSHKGLWQKAFDLLAATNPMPEITGRVCPAPCEYACVLGVNDEPVTIRENELAIIEQAFKKGIIKANPPEKRTGKKVAVVGSGPAGLSAAAGLNRLGHTVTVFERADKLGGILRYGMPDFKLEKHILDRRIKLWQDEGIGFRVNAQVRTGGRKRNQAPFQARFDAVCFACGSRTPRDMGVEGRGLNGIHFAMDYLTQSNRRVAGEKIAENRLIDARGKRVVVIGGGDTGADCAGTAHRQGAGCVVQIELLAKPPGGRTEKHPWPQYPLLLKTSTSHKEGGERHWSVLTRKFVGENGRVRKILCERTDKRSGAFEIEADLVILAIGFLKNPGVKKREGIFCAGDMRRGPSLVVWAIKEGLDAAKEIHSYLIQTK